MFDGDAMISSENRSAPAGVQAPVGPGLTADKERLVVKNSIERDRAAICTSYLKLAARDLTRAKRARIQYIRLGRLYGMTNRQIGNALGVSDTAVRQLLRRNAEVE